MKNWLQLTYWHNTIGDYLIALGIIVVGLIVLRLIKNLALASVKRWSAKSKTTLDDFLIRIIEKAVLPIVYVAILYAGITSLTLPLKFTNILHIAMVVVVVFFSIRLITSLLEYLLVSYMRRQDKGEEHRGELRGMLLIFNAIIWCLGIVFLLDNMGFDVATVLTGLGIGGIAIALAAQAVLGDLFAYFVIFFDRPFEIGDFLIVDDKMGSVEHIGLKTTRLRSLGGEQLIFSNKNLTDSRIHNYKRMEKRRVVFSISVEYGTPAAQLEKIPGMIRSIVEAQPDVVFDRAHFAKYSPYSLDYEIVYNVMSADFNHYMDIQQAINLEILRSFERERIGFAHPIQTLFMPKLKQELSGENIQ